MFNLHRREIKGPPCLMRREDMESFFPVFLSFPSPGCCPFSFSLVPLRGFFLSFFFSLHFGSSPRGGVRDGLTTLLIVWSTISFNAQLQGTFFLNELKNTTGVLPNASAFRRLFFVYLSTLPSALGAVSPHSSRRAAPSPPLQLSY